MILSRKFFGRREGGKFVGLDHAIPLGDNGITLKKAKGL